MIIGHDARIQAVTLDASELTAYSCISAYRVTKVAQWMLVDVILARLCVDASKNHDFESATRALGKVNGSGAAR